MSLRAVLGAGAALMLPLPLVLLLSAVLRPRLPESVSGRQVIPILEFEERQRLQTYHRDCATTSECEPPMGCMLDARSRVQYCTDSKCMTDEQCRDGQVCRNVAAEGGRLLVRFCVPLGIRKEGERCVEISEDQGGACGPGLLCGGKDGWCGRPCRVGDAESCPEGFFCADTVPESLCLPTCEKRGCPEGQHCIRHQEGTSACACVYGPQCQQTPCPEGRKCEVIHSSDLPDRVWMECEQRCGKGLPPCPAGFVCDGWSCQRSCDPKRPDCPEGYRCDQRSPDRPLACNPDW